MSSSKAKKVLAPLFTSAALAQLNGTQEYAAEHLDRYFQSIQDTSIAATPKTKKTPKPRAIIQRDDGGREKVLGSSRQEDNLGDPSGVGIGEKNETSRDVSPKRNQNKSAQIETESNDSSSKKHESLPQAQVKEIRKSVKRKMFDKNDEKHEDEEQPQVSTGGKRQRNSNKTTERNAANKRRKTEADLPQKLKTKSKSDKHKGRRKTVQIKMFPEVGRQGSNKTKQRENNERSKRQTKRSTKEMINEQTRQSGDDRNQEDNDKDVNDKDVISEPEMTAEDQHSPGKKRKPGKKIKTSGNPEEGIPSDGSPVEDIRDVDVGSHGRHWRFLHQSISSLQEPIMFGGMVRHHYMRLTHGDGGVSEKVITNVISKYNKLLLKHHHNNGLSDEEKKKLVSSLDRIERENNSNYYSEFFQQAALNLEFHPPGEPPPQLMMSSEEFKEYTELVSRISEQQDKRRAHIDKLDRMTKLITELDRLKKHDQKYGNSTNIDKKQHIAKMQEAVNDAKAISQFIV